MCYQIILIGLWWWLGVASGGVVDEVSEVYIEWNFSNRFLLKFQNNNISIVKKAFFFVKLNFSYFLFRIRIVVVSWEKIRCNCPTSTSSVSCK